MPFQEIGKVDREALDRIIAEALREDIGSGDVTTNALVPGSETIEANIVARERLIVCGGITAKPIFAALGASVEIHQNITEGEQADAGETIIVLRGPARSILSAERLLLNLMQRLSGIATTTRRYVDATGSWDTAILDTRKTTPGLRILEKYAVRCGGGRNHRKGLYDMAMIKDNHRECWSRFGSDGLAGAVRRIRDLRPGMAVEIEVDDEQQLAEAIEVKPDWILLDNMNAAELSRCVAINAGRCRLEASGGITIADIPSIAATGVDAISVGALTHSARAVDIALDMA